MSVAIRAITRLQDADDINVSLGAGVENHALTWNNGSGKWTAQQMPSSQVFYASRAGATLDSSLSAGGGTDDTAALQAVLNAASSGSPVHLVIDGVALVSGLNVYGNTTVEFLSGCGLFLKANSNRAIIRNVNRSRGTITDRNIRIIGGYLNGNRVNQTGVGAYSTQEADNTWITGLQIYGVEYLEISGLTVHEAVSWAIHIANASFVQLHNIETSITTGVITQDGIHFNGPIQYLTARDLRLEAWDDALAFNAGDGNAVDITIANLAGPYVGQGVISDVVVDGLELRGALQGVRLLSHNVTSRIDRIVISNVVGSVHNFSLVAGSYDNAGAGDIGSVTLENWDVDLLSPVGVGDTSYSLMWWDSSIEHLTLRNVRVNDPLDNRPLIWFKSTALVDLLTIDGFNVYESASGAAGVIPLRVDGGISRLVASNCHWSRGAALARQSEWLKFVGASASITELVLNGITVNRASYVVNQNSGALAAVQAVGVRHTDDNSGYTFRFGNGTVAELIASNWKGSTLYTTAGSGAVTAVLGDAVTFGSSAPTYSSAEIGNVAEDTVAVTFSKDIKATDYKLGVAIKVDGSTATISTATRQTDNAIVHYVLSAAAVYGQSVTWEYNGAIGFISDLVGVQLGTTAAQSVTNNVAGANALLTNLVSYWKLDETSGERADSVVASGNNLSDSNTVGYGTGKISNSASFASADKESLYHADNAGLSTGDIDFTISAWLYIATTDTDVKGAFAKWETSPNAEFFLGKTAENKVMFIVSPDGDPGSSSLGIATWGTAMNVSTWYFVIAWHDATANTVNISVNNGTTISVAHTLGVHNSGASLVIGGFFGVPVPDISKTWNGLIDEVGFWKRVLTSDERTALYNSGNGATYPFS